VHSQAGRPRATAKVPSPARPQKIAEAFFWRDAVDEARSRIAQPVRAWAQWPVGGSAASSRAVEVMTLRPSLGPSGFRIVKWPPPPPHRGGEPSFYAGWREGAVDERAPARTPSGRERARRNQERDADHLPLSCVRRT